MAKRTVGPRARQPDTLPLGSGSPDDANPGRLRAERSGEPRQGGPPAADRRASTDRSGRTATRPLTEAGGKPSAAPFVPDTTSIRTLTAAAHECHGCDLYKTATQVVFGAGPKGAHVMFVGEQLGDQEDRQGAPFVGPAGALLDKALEAAGIPRNEVYVTNAV
jgi:hypothetical protein